MLIDKRGLAVWVCADTRVGAYHILRKCREILVGGCLAVTVNNRLHEKFLVSRQCGFTAMLLEDNQVTACVSPGIVGERVVRQTQCGHQIGTLHHLRTDKGRSGVHHTLRCDKGYQSTLAHGVKCFEEEIIVYRLCRLSVSQFLARGIDRIRHGKVSERDIGTSHIKVAVVIRLNLFEALNSDFRVRMQCYKDFAREQIFLKRHSLCIGIISHERVNENTLSGTRLQILLDFYAIGFERIKDSIDNRRRSIERRQH